METVYKYLAILVAVAALMAASYYTGHSKGYVAGYNQGKSDQQVVINNLTNQLNTEHALSNKEVTAVEQKAATEASTIDSTQNKKEEQKQQVITKYVTQYVEKPGSTTQNSQTAPACSGISAAGVDAINSILDIDAAPPSATLGDTPYGVAYNNETLELPSI